MSPAVSVSFTPPVAFVRMRLRMPRTPIVRQKLPGGVAYTQGELEEAFTILSAVTWLRFWGRQGYAFKVGGTASS